MKESGDKIWRTMNPLFIPCENSSSASSSADPTELGLKSSGGAAESSIARSASSEDQLKVVHGVRS
jgi:hypothetical protein